MSFAIVSLPRTGSTAVYRVLSADPGTSIAYEPDLSGAGLDPVAIRRHCASLFERYSGIKHVWDPNGWPFRNRGHVSTLATLSGSDELTEANRAVADSAEKVIFLRRRNVFDRTLSDLFGQQTSLWGHRPARPHKASEAQAYERAVRRKTPRDIDEGVFGWYMRHSWKAEEAIIRAVPPSRARVFCYEDLFEPARLDAADYSIWRDLAAWAGVTLDFDMPQIASILSPASKLNSEDIYARIPNYARLRALWSPSPALRGSHG